MSTSPHRNGDLDGRRILVVDDDPTVAEVAGTYLTAAGFVVDRAADGAEALRQLDALAPDLVVLDVMLPDIDGIETCRRIREAGDTAVLMLTARTSQDDRIDGLEAGADDYLTKPFSPRELVLRVRSVLRRTTSAAPSDAPIVCGGYRIDPAARIATYDGVELNLTAREFDLLEFLARRPGQAFDRTRLLQAVWGWSIGDLSTVTVHVRRLREKIEPDSTHPSHLVTVWGVGYRFDPTGTPPAERSAP
ncbi:response regulator transcription factor [Microbacterium aquimaris]|uniref:Response regulator transcription factor n=1 Tax=Microbacterium aquimaris TaxID=459816 RepID=A0ABU5N8F6_9MICO|nr:response regulator transcription factor [Microbacterium aquimaris]MDZ8162267.1 response regulator transcription factor [Microbacterium aquimaris]